MNSYDYSVKGRDQKPIIHRNIAVREIFKALMWFAIMLGRSLTLWMFEVLFYRTK